MGAAARPKERRGLLRVWTYSLCGAALLLIVLAQAAARDPLIAGRAAALEDADALLGALDLRADSWLRGLSAGSGGPPTLLRFRWDADGRMLGRQPLPRGTALVDDASIPAVTVEGDFTLQVNTSSSQTYVDVAPGTACLLRYGPQGLDLRLDAYGRRFGR